MFRCATVWPSRAVLAAGLALCAPAAMARDAPDEPMSPPSAATQAEPVETGPYGLPLPLSAADAAQVRRIFMLRARGRVADSISATALLDDKTLLAPILADRYLAPTGKWGKPPAWQDLEGWLTDYPDSPDAPAIYNLLLARLPADQPPPAAPSGEMLGPYLEDALPASPPDPHIPRRPLLERTAAADIAAGRFDAVIELARAPGLEPAVASGLYADVALGRFSRGEDEAAMATVAGAAAAGQDSAGRLFLAGGFAAWRLQKWSDAARLFEQAWSAPATAPEDRSAAAYWRGRVASHLPPQAGEPDTAWFGRAGEDPLCFYGLLGRAQLKEAVAKEQKRPLARLPRGIEKLDADDSAALMATPGGKRALALLQVGQKQRAEAELRRLWPHTAGNDTLRRAILKVARAGGLPLLASQLAAILANPALEDRDDARYPAPRLLPAGGFEVDPALVYGIIRQESFFDTDAISTAGARGPMQLMPRTASLIANMPELADIDVDTLHDPALNLDLGQRYLVAVGTLKAIHGDLMRVVASYYAGPGSVAQWADDGKGGEDPLIFLESIPAPDVRQYVRRALTNTWLYAARFHLPSPSLDEMAAGTAPRFAPLPVRRDFVPPHLR